MVHHDVHYISCCNILNNVTTKPYPLNAEFPRRPFSQRGNLSVKEGGLLLSRIAVQYHRRRRA